MSQKLLRKETISSTPLAEVWSVWTTKEGVISFLAPKANITLEDQGAYEIFFDPDAPLGFKGTEGCKVLGVNQMKILSVEWRAPPQFPNARRLKTRVDIYFERVEAVTRVRVEHSGWQEGEEWDESYEFFDRAWDLDLARMQQRFSSGPIDWRKPYLPTWNKLRHERIRDHIPVGNH
ncbi:MAG TPA: SRPBCC domain-containing protein [Candidatus Bathyarchaeia archaeon]|jgi:uncharacterized protein YndB with AHSA1/START domain|nr:SRPBCC domain-containing protein [Candidatus Bathyarchaeia archaeon]